MKDKRVVATWSGGIDSTAVIGQLLVGGWDVIAVSLTFSPDHKFVQREAAAREELATYFDDVAGGHITYYEDEAEWLWNFSPDGVEIPTRNRRIMDYLIAAYCTPRDLKNIAMGEYIGCDTWVVRDHVGAADCDARALGAYLYEQYGMDWRLLTLADFGESRYKSDRLRIGAGAIGWEAMGLTTNCLNDDSVHCGRCYKCLERAAAFATCGIPDPTTYRVNPTLEPRYHAYLSQMQGEPVTASVSEFAS